MTPEACKTTLWAWHLTFKTLQDLVLISLRQLISSHQPPPPLPACQSWGLFFHLTATVYAIFPVGISSPPLLSAPRLIQMPSPQMSQRGHNLSLPSVPMNLFTAMIYLILYLQCLALSLTYGMDVDAYLMDEWKFDISFLRGPGICFRLECHVTRESSVHHPEHCCLHKQCLPTSPSLTPWSPASLVPGCPLSFVVPFLWSVSLFLLSLVPLEP